MNILMHSVMLMAVMCTSHICGHADRLCLLRPWGREASLALDPAARKVAALATLGQRYAGLVTEDGAISENVSILLPQNCHSQNNMPLIQGRCLPQHVPQNHLQESCLACVQLQWQCM